MLKKCQRARQVCVLPCGGGASRRQVQDEAQTFQRAQNQRRLGLVCVQKGQKLLESSVDHGPGLAADSYVHLTEEDIKMHQLTTKTALRRNAASLPVVTDATFWQHLSPHERTK